MYHRLRHFWVAPVQAEDMIVNETFHLFPYDAAVPNHNTIHLLHSIYTQYEPIYIHRNET